VPFIALRLEKNKQTHRAGDSEKKKFFWKLLTTYACVSYAFQFSTLMAGTKSDKHPKAGKKMTGKASVGDVSLSSFSLLL
jgi:hypothetical protein